MRRLKSLFTIKTAIKLALGLFVVLVVLCGSTVLFVAVASKLADTPPDSVAVEMAVPYAKVGERSLLLDIARPKQGDGPFPLVICIHGGGWKAGDRHDFLQATFSLAQQGYVAATLQYRLVPEARFPAQIQDVKAAVRYLKSRAKELKIDPDRVGVLGGSAGGHLALLLATTDDKAFEPIGDHKELSSRVQAVVALAGPSDLTPDFPKASEEMVTDLIGKSRAEAPEAYKLASPVHYVDPTDAPILLIHGEKDELVPYQQAGELIEAYKKAGVEGELYTIKDGGHGGGGKPEDWAEGIVRTVKFLDQHLKTKKH